MIQAKGSFEVKLVPQTPSDESGGAAVGSMLIDKQFQGDLEATSKGLMLGHRSAVDGSAGYVAMEIVTGSLHKKTGTFVLQHMGIVDRGAQEMKIVVVPDSAAGELEGLAGSLNIIIKDGKHYYKMDYTIADKT